MTENKDGFYNAEERDRSHCKEQQLFTEDSIMLTLPVFTVVSDSSAKKK